MKASDIEEMSDVVKYIQHRGNQQGYKLLEAKQVENRVFVTYWKLVDPSEHQLAPWHKLLYSTTISKNKPFIKHSYVKLDLCKFIEPYKSNASMYRNKRESILEWKEDVEL